MKPDLLLLGRADESLDVHALTWLEVSDDGENRRHSLARSRVLNECTTATAFLHHKKLRYYGGSYDTFLKAERITERTKSRPQRRRDVKH